MKIKTEKVIQTATDTCHISLSAIGNVTIGAVSISPVELPEFCASLKEAIDQLLAENNQP